MTEVPEAQQTYLDALAEIREEVLKGELVGVYVHGSIARSEERPPSRIVHRCGTCGGNRAKDGM